MTQNAKKDNFAERAASWDNPSKIDMTNKFVEAVLHKIKPEKNYHRWPSRRTARFITLQSHNQLITGIYCIF